MTTGRTGPGAYGDQRILVGQTQSCFGGLIEPCFCMKKGQDHLANPSWNRIAACVLAEIRLTPYKRRKCGKDRRAGEDTGKQRWRERRGRTWKGESGDPFLSQIPSTSRCSHCTCSFLSPWIHAAIHSTLNPPNSFQSPPLLCPPLQCSLGGVSLLLSPTPLRLFSLNPPPPLY